MVVVFSLVVIITFSLGSVQCGKPTTIIALNECFIHRPGYRIQLKAEDVAGTDSIQFKDDCLRACLRTLIQEAFTCRSLMHMPRDDDCVLTTMDSKSAQMEKVEDFDVMPVNFYENICATVPLGPDAIVVEAKFDGYKGGEGVVKFAQKRDLPLQMLILLDGVKTEARLDVLYRRENVKDCFKLKREELKSMEKVVDLETDSNGMAILPWRELTGVDILSEHVINTTVILIDSQTQEVVDCGKMAARNMSDFERALNDASLKSTSGLTMALVALIVCIAAQR